MREVKAPRSARFRLIRALAVIAVLGPVLGGCFYGPGPGPGWCYWHPYRC
jgi:hypothetical protein